MGSGAREHDDRAALSSEGALLLHALGVERKHGLDDDARERSEEGCVEAESSAPRERKCENPLPNGRWRKNALEQIEHRRRHLAPETRGAKSAAPAPERHEPAFLAVCTFYVGEAPAQEPAIQIPLELFADEGGQANGQGALLDCAVSVARLFCTTL